jgi:hypothetical protein
VALARWRLDRLARAGDVVDLAPTLHVATALRVVIALVQTQVLRVRGLRPPDHRLVQGFLQRLHVVSVGRRIITLSFTLS